MHSDIKTGGWVAALPAAARPYALLARLDRPVGWWLLLLPGWWAIMLAGGGAFSLSAKGWHLFVLFFMGAVVMRGAGCVVNDLWDRELDKQVERTQRRPLASGDVTTKQALAFLGFLLLAGFIILMQMNSLTIILGILSLPLIGVYPLMKRVTWWPQLFLGLTFNFGALMGWSAVTGEIALAALLLYAGGIFWTLGYDTIYAHQDKEDDALAGIKSTALKFGDASTRWVRGFYTLAMALIVMAGVDAGAGWVFYALMVLAGFHLAWQMSTWRPDDAQSSLKIFRSNRDFGLIILTACVLS